MKNNKPINVAIPNTSVQKMTAIANLSSAVVELSRALNSTNVQVNVSNNSFVGAKTAVSIKTDER